MCACVKMEKKKERAFFFSFLEATIKKKIMFVFTNAINIDNQLLINGAYDISRTFSFFIFIMVFPYHFASCGLFVALNIFYGLKYRGIIHNNNRVC